jgi:hypothetical protein
MDRTGRLAGLLALLLVLGACSSSTRTVSEPAPGADLPTLAELETFDAEPYRVEAPEEAPAPTVEHEVPEVLMRAGRTGETDSAKVPVRRSGFRIQVFSGEEKARAEEVMNQAINWWEAIYARTDSVRSVFPEELPVYIEYGAPYYRVRMGDFPTRSRAEKALPIVHLRFPDAWIIPDQVLVYR